MNARLSKYALRLLRPVCTWLLLSCLATPLVQAQEEGASPAQDATHPAPSEVTAVAPSTTLAGQVAPEAEPTAQAPAARPSSPGEAEFSQGLEHSRTGRWADAAAAFEASLERADRPATRYNLVRAYAEQDRPLEVARHALAFLAGPRSPHRADARAEVEASLAEALRKLAILELSVTPADAEVHVDDQPLDVVDEAGRVYLQPGNHSVRLHADGYLAFEETRLLPSGRITSVAVALAKAPNAGLPTAVAPAKPARWRRPLAWSLAAAGTALWAAGLGTYASSAIREGELADLAPTEPGSLAKAQRYKNLRDAAGPLALSGGALATGGALLAERAPRRGWGWGMLAAGTGLAAAGLFVTFNEANDVGQWNLAQPRRALGLLLVGASLPVLGLSARWAWLPRGSALALTPTGVRGTF